MAEVGVEGLDKLYASIDTCIDEVGREARQGLKKAGMQIVADAQRNLRTAGYNGGTVNNTGRLSQSGKTQETKDGAIDAGFFSGDGERGYAAVVEYGSKKHWFPPVDALRAWVYKKLRVTTEEVDSAAYLVGRAIKRRGLSPHPFFAPAVNKNKRAVSKAITDAVNKVTNRNR